MEQFFTCGYCYKAFPADSRDLLTIDSTTLPQTDAENKPLKICLICLKKQKAEEYFDEPLKEAKPIEKKKEDPGKAPGTNLKSYTKKGLLDIVHRDSNF